MEHLTITFEHKIRVAEPRAACLHNTTHLPPLHEDRIAVWRRTAHVTKTPRVFLPRCKNSKPFCRKNTHPEQKHPRDTSDTTPVPPMLCFVFCACRAYCCTCFAQPPAPSGAQPVAGGEKPRRAPSKRYQDHAHKGGAQALPNSPAGISLHVHCRISALPIVLYCGIAVPLVAVCVCQGGILASFSMPMCAARVVECCRFSVQQLCKMRKTMCKIGGRKYFC